jgi:hypothetical protein
LSRRKIGGVRGAFGTVGEALPIMSTLNDTNEADAKPRAQTLSWMASLSVAAGELRAAEGYLLELLAWCAFADRGVASVFGEGAEASS